MDAGIAGICAAAGKNAPEDIDDAALDRAFETLVRIMTSEAMFKERRSGKKKSSKFATSEMTAIFPNGPLSQASYSSDDRKRDEYKKRVRGKYEAVKAYLAGKATPDPHLGICFVDGSPAVMRVGNDEFPLVDSKNRRNFHPGLQAGHAVGAKAAFALEFFPLSVLRTGINSGFFWFVHTASEKIAIACARLTLDNMNRSISRGDGLGFYGDWHISTEMTDAALVALIRDLMSGRIQQALTWRDIEDGGLPVTAYVFSNDNRRPNIAAHDLPHRLFYFFAVLNNDKGAFDRFNREVLQDERVGQRVPRKMLGQEPILTDCFARGNKNAAGSLQGGWRAHSLYATEVLGMNGMFIHTIEEVSERIIAHEKADDLIVALQTQDAPTRALIRLTRMGLVSFDEYSHLVPPDVRTAAKIARDYLLAALYDRKQAQANDRKFECWSGELKPAAEKHALITLVEAIGSKLSGDRDLAKSLATELAKAKRVSDLRRAILRIMRKGGLSWSDFVMIFPPEDIRKSFEVRDYLLAYLFAALRDAELPEPEPADEEAIERVEEIVA
ncbi:MAG: hypothetical protein ACP5VE_05460 [Chthonomonadales bacterium]